MKKLLLYGVSATILLVGASEAGSYLIDLSPGRGPTPVYDQAIFIEVTEAMQASLSSATGVIDSFPRMQKGNKDNSWKGSVQKMDNAFMLPSSLLSGDSLNDHVDLYTQFGTLGHLSFPSQTGFEEDASREPGTPVPEPATVLILGIGLVGLSALGRKELIR